VKSGGGWLVWGIPQLKLALPSCNLLMIDLSTLDGMGIGWTIDLPVWWKTHPAGLENPGEKRECLLKAGDRTGECPNVITSKGSGHL